MLAGRIHHVSGVSQRFKADCALLVDVLPRWLRPELPVFNFSDVVLEVFVLDQTLDKTLVMRETWRNFFNELLERLA
eukprot:3109075-Rhodomonas_salina.1